MTTHHGVNSLGIDYLLGETISQRDRKYTSGYRDKETASHHSFVFGVY